MIHRKFEVETYYEVAVCSECGGSIDVPHGEEVYTSYPPKKNYKCNQCGKVYMLSMENWPQIKHNTLSVIRED